MMTMTRTEESTAVAITSGPTLLLAFELGERIWKLGFTTGLGQRPRVRQIPARATDRVLEEIDTFLPRKRGDAFPTLTRREHEILELLARGCDNAQIAAHLELSEKTVRNNITNVFDKMGVENRGQAIVRAREAGLGIEPAN